MSSIIARRIVVAPVVLALCAGLSACEVDDEPTVGIVQANISNAKAYDCAETCKSLILEINVRNISNSLYCVSAHYDDPGVFAFVSIPGDVNGEAVASEGALGSRHLSNDEERKYVDELLRAPNFVIQPGAGRTFRALSDSRFSIQRGTKTLNVKFIYYPCSEKRMKKYGYKLEELSSPLSFEVRP
jgi:hypothetical protein